MRQNGICRLCQKPLSLGTLKAAVFHEITGVEYIELQHDCGARLESRAYFRSFPIVTEVPECLGAVADTSTVLAEGCKAN